MPAPARDAEDQDATAALRVLDRVHLSGLKLSPRDLRALLGVAERRARYRQAMIVSASHPRDITAASRVIERIVRSGLILDGEDRRGLLELSELRAEDRQALLVSGGRRGASEIPATKLDESGDWTRATWAPAGSSAVTRVSNRPA